MSYYPLPEDFSCGEEKRQEIIKDVLFSPNPPSVECILECIPKPSTRSNAKSWNNNMMSWDAWSVGPLNKAYEIRYGENIAGWGSQGSHQRIMVENSLYNTVAELQKIIEQQHKKIQEFTDIMDAISRKDDWVDIEDTVNMI